MHTYPHTQVQGLIQLVSQLLHLNTQSILMLLLYSFTVLVLTWLSVENYCSSKFCDLIVKRCYRNHSASLHIHLIPHFDSLTPLSVPSQLPVAQAVPAVGLVPPSFPVSMAMPPPGYGPLPPFLRAGFNASQPPPGKTQQSDAAASEEYWIKEYIYIYIV